MENIFYFQWHITDQCNQRCKHCYQSTFSPDQELDEAALIHVAETILTGLAAKGYQAHFTLTGGEPFLKRDFFPLLAYLNSHPQVRELMIITNGSCLDQAIFQRLKVVTKLSTMKLSLEGATAATHDMIRSPGDFERTCRAVSALKKHTAYRVGIMFTLMKRNQHEVADLPRLCKTLAADEVIIERFIPLGTGSQWRDEVLGADEWKQCVAGVCDIDISDTRLDDMRIYRGYRLDFTEGYDTPALSGAICTVGENGLCIMPNADIYPCRRFNESIGNLKQQSFAQVLEASDVSPALRDRSRLEGKCGRCENIACIGCRALARAMTGNCWAEDRQCWQEKDT